MNDEFFEKLREKVLPYFAKGDGHDFDHVERVYNNSLKIGESEPNVDMDIVRAATLLHDIARSKKGVCHAEEGSKMVPDILKEVGFPEEKIDAVVHAVAVHRYSKGLKAETREAEILQDADRLDALGAIIVARALEKAGKDGIPVYDPDLPVMEVYDGSNTTAINHLCEKSLRIVPESFKTAKAQEIARERYDFVKEFVERFKKEWGGEL